LAWYACGCAGAHLIHERDEQRMSRNKDTTCNRETMAILLPKNWKGEEGRGGEQGGGLEKRKANSIGHAPVGRTTRNERVKNDNMKALRLASAGRLASRRRG